MSAIKQSVAWWCFVPNLMQPEAFVDAVAEVGYAAIDLVPLAFCELVRSRGLAISSINGHQSITDGLNRPDQHQRIADELRANIAQAQHWGAANLVCFSGNRYERDDMIGIQHTAAGLSQVAAEAEAAGVTLVLELLNSKIDHPGYECDHSTWGVAVCEQVASPRVKLLYDIYHMQIMEGDIIRTITAMHSHIGLFHTGGVPGRHEIDETQELNYPAIFRAIRETAYQGYVAHEFLPRGEAKRVLHDTFEQAARYLS